MNAINEKLAYMSLFCGRLGIHFFTKHKYEEVYNLKKGAKNIISLNLNCQTLNLTSKIFA